MRLLLENQNIFKCRFKLVNVLLKNISMAPDHAWDKVHLLKSGLTHLYNLLSCHPFPVPVPLPCPTLCSILWLHWTIFPRTCLTPSSFEAFLWTCASVAKLFSLCPRKFYSFFCLGCFIRKASLLPLVWILPVLWVMSLWYHWQHCTVIISLLSVSPTVPGQFHMIPPLSIVPGK